MKDHLRSTVLIVSTLAALAAATAMAAAQPGAEFQDQGIREDNGVPRFGEPGWHRGYRSYGYAAGAFAMAPLYVAPRVAPRYRFGRRLPRRRR